MVETSVPRDFQKTVRFEPGVVLALNASYSLKLEALSDLTQRHTVERALEEQGSTFALSSGPLSGAQSSWVADQSGAAAPPSPGRIGDNSPYILRGLPKGKSQRLSWISKQPYPNTTSETLQFPQMRRQTLAIPRNAWLFGLARGLSPSRGIEDNYLHMLRGPKKGNVKENLGYQYVD